MSDLLARLRVLHEAASPHPWKTVAIPASDECLTLPHDHYDIYREVVPIRTKPSPPGTLMGTADMANPEAWNVACASFSPDDVELVIAMRNALPLLLDVAEAARECVACVPTDLTLVRLRAALRRLEEAKPDGR